MYRLSKEQIFSNLEKGYILEHISGFKIEVTNVFEIEGEQFISGVVNGINKNYSVDFLYDNELIQDNRLFEKIDENIVAEHSENKNLSNKKDSFTQANSDWTKNGFCSRTEMAYSELFKLMAAGDSSFRRYSYDFWHYTTINNLISIVKDRAFKSRYSLLGNIPDDNFVNNIVSKEVLLTNNSKRTSAYARFYLRPLNKSYFSWFSNLGDKNNAVYIRISKAALFASQNPTFLTPYNAHGATNEDLDWNFSLNKKGKRKFIIRNFENFNFEKIYAKYDPELSFEDKNCQQAEFLVYKELPIDFIEQIIFMTENAMNVFLKEIIGKFDYQGISKKCIVNSDFFYNYI